MFLPKNLFRKKQKTKTSCLSVLTSQAIVLRGAGFIHVHNLAAVDEEVDEGKEKRPIDASLIEIVGGTVRCGDHHHSVSEETGEQLSENHRIGDVRHLWVQEEEQKSRASVSMYSWWR